MDLIGQFIERYRREYDFYDQAARTAAQMLQLRLEAAGIRAIVTSRAKSPLRLEAKIRQRSQSRTYQTLDDISADIVDLAGLRVALYFPGERQQVETIVRDAFNLITTPKEFPHASSPSYAKRFSGYWATHFRAQLKEALLNDAQRRYSEARLEIQVASVLMHAWAEVEHDLVYKPLEGTLSEDEYAILDELNGLVIAGEIALERLQKAGEVRVNVRGRKFANHYDLAAYLLDRAKPLLKGPLGDSVLGRVDVLFALLQRIGLDTPEALNRYLEGLHPDTERRPLSEQIVDQLVAEDENRYRAYEELRAAKRAGPPLQTPEEVLVEAETHEAIGYFLSQWIEFERFIRQMAQGRIGDRPAWSPTPRLLDELGVYSQEARRELEQIRRLRNHLVHGVEIPPASQIREAADRLRSILMASSPPANPKT